MHARKNMFGASSRVCLGILGLWASFKLETGKHMQSRMNHKNESLEIKEYCMM